jgi:hypothetical protein
MAQASCCLSSEYQRAASLFHRRAGEMQTAAPLNRLFRNHRLARAALYDPAPDLVREPFPFRRIGARRTPDVCKSFTNLPSTPTAHPVWPPFAATDA